MKITRSYQAIVCFLLLLLSPLMNVSLDGRELKHPCDVSHIVQSLGVNPELSALVIVSLEDDNEWTSGSLRTKTPYSPASTTKIPHTLIALEEGYAESGDTSFKWDGQKRFLEVWNQDQTLASAFKYSVIWVYQQITGGLGYQTMSSWIDQFNYGNRNLGTPQNLTTYSLEGPLETSCYDQIQFLTALAQETLPLEANTFAIGKPIMCEETGENWALFSKTGYNGQIGWYVGWVEAGIAQNKQTYVFAFNMDIASWDELPLRKTVVRAALDELCVIPDHSQNL